MKNFRVRCTKSMDDRFKVGKIYDVDDNGQVIGDKNPGDYLRNEEEKFSEWHKNCGWVDYDFEEVTALPRICYILGGEDTPLEIGKEFGYEGDNGVYRISEHGYRESKMSNGWWCSTASEYSLTKFINHPEKIIRKPKIEFSDDEKAFMRLLIKKKHKWIARDRVTTSLVAYTEEPYINSCEDFDSNGYYADIPEFLFPQITPDNSPINMEDYI